MKWDDYVKEWSRPPVDDIGYLSSADMLGWDDVRLRNTIDDMRSVRYDGWRNHLGLWREYLGLDRGGRRVLEYGCGVGMEALELSLAGNEVSVADLSDENIQLTRRVLRMNGQRVRSAYHVQEDWPFLNASFGTYEVINCSGVLHHIRKARLTMERFHEILEHDGQVRLLVYSDVGWRIATGTEPPPEPVDEAEGFRAFVSFMDGVGDYATWYDRDKIDRMFGELFEIDRFSYLTPDGRYCAAVLTRKD